MATEPQQKLIEPGEQYIQMSAHVPRRWNDVRLAKGATWRGIMKRGIEDLEEQPIDHYGDVESLKSRIAKMANLLDAAYKRIQQLESKVDVSTTAENG